MRTRTVAPANWLCGGTWQDNHKRFAAVRVIAHAVQLALIFDSRLSVQAELQSYGKYALSRARASDTFCKE